MKTLFGLLLAIALISIPANAQKDKGGSKAAPVREVGGGYIPSRGPTPHPKAASRPAPDFGGRDGEASTKSDPAARVGFVEAARSLSGQLVLDPTS